LSPRTITGITVAMKRTALFTLTAAVAMSLAGPRGLSDAPKSGSPDPAEEIRTLEKAFDEAIVRRDVSALDQMTSDDFVLISLHGDLHAKAEVLNYFVTHASELEYRETDSLRIRVYGDAAVVTGRTRQTVQEKGKDQRDAYLFAHVYIRQKGRWLLVAAQLTRVGMQ